MVKGVLRPTVAKVNCQAIYHNIRNEITYLNDNIDIFAVVKANGYGHGAVKVAEIAVKAGVTGFCVALLDEAIELRESGRKEPMLILGITPSQQVEYAVHQSISLTVATKDWLVAADQHLQKNKIEGHLKIHLKIDSGMGRIGFKTNDDLLNAIAYINQSDQLELEGIYTHFATADTEDFFYFEEQQQNFLEIIKNIPKDIKYLHTANTATSFWHENWYSNMVRLGIGMYGLNPSGTELLSPYPLEEALSLETELVHIKQIEQGESVGYGASYQAQQTEWIGTLPIGYADGFRRSFQNFSVLIEGEKAPIVGRVCMDQCMIRLSKEYPVGTKVTIFGENGAAFNSIQDGAEHIGTINYEIPCSLTERVPIQYYNEIE